MGYITIRKTDNDKLTIDTAFSTVAVVDYLKEEIRSLSVDDLYRYVKETGIRSSVKNMFKQAKKRRHAKRGGYEE